MRFARFASRRTFLQWPGMAVAVVGVGMVAEAVAAFTVEAVVAFMVVEAVGSMGSPDFTVEAVMAEAVGFMDLPPVVAGPTLVMGGVVMH